jgi:phosphatidate cytidylyltransferase
MLKQRIITGVILFLLVLAGLFYLPPQGFDIAVMLVIAMAAWEFSACYWHDHLVSRILFLGLLFCFLFGSQFVIATPILILAGVWWLLAPVSLVTFSKRHSSHLQNKFLGYIVGLLIFVPCFVGMVEIYRSFGVGYLLLVLFIVWAADIGAYFSGKYFGKRLLAPMISPKKTVEGVYGGLLVSSIVAVIGGAILHVHGIRWLSFITLALIAALWSVIGDLFESMIKRQADIKDSGHILPGHGGVYDRIDSLTAAIPIFALGLMLISF